MFNQTSVLVVVIGFLHTSATLANNEIKLFSAEGYPYKQLINRVDSIKILFTEKSGSIQCRVDVINNTQHQQTEYVRITAKQFEKKPLASCLPRVKAKALLADTF